MYCPYVLLPTESTPQIPTSILVDGKISKQAPLDLPPTTYEVDTPAVAVAAAAAASEARSL